TYKQNEVGILYLPALSSHILQPLDLNTFSPLKLQYQKKIPDLVYPNNGAQVKKQQLIQVYQKAQAETFTTCILCTSWSVVGLFP
ncbi:hypothetical protein C7212DRAFT_192488, partial [Tuber magnatum]